MSGQCLRRYPGRLRTPRRNLSVKSKNPAMEKYQARRAQQTQAPARSPEKVTGLRSFRQTGPAVARMSRRHYTASVATFVVMKPLQVPWISGMKTVDDDLPVLVLTNDDGIAAPGMQALIAAARGMGRCRVIAPCGPLSGCGHQVTTHQPIGITRDAQGHCLSVRTPADCIRLALVSLATDVRWVVSGINAGGNLEQTFTVRAPWRPPARRRSAACRALRSRTTSPREG